MQVSISQQTVQCLRVSPGGILPGVQIFFYVSLESSLGDYSPIGPPHRPLLLPQRNIPSRDGREGGADSRPLAPDAHQAPGHGQEGGASSGQQEAAHGDLQPHRGPSSEAGAAVGRGEGGNSLQEFTEGEWAEINGLSDRPGL